MLRPLPMPMPDPARGVEEGLEGDALPDVWVVASVMGACATAGATGVATWGRARERCLGTSWGEGRVGVGLAVRGLEFTIQCHPCACLPLLIAHGHVR